MVNAKLKKPTATLSVLVKYVLDSGDVSRCRTTGSKKITVRTLAFERAR